MAYSYAVYEGDGETRLFSLPFPYIDKTHISVLVDDLPVPFTFSSASVVETAGAPNSGALVKVSRTTHIAAPLVVFNSASTLTASALNLLIKQMLYRAQEEEDAGNAAMAEIAVLTAMLEQVEADLIGETARASAAEAELAADLIGETARASAAEAELAADLIGETARASAAEAELAADLIGETARASAAEAELAADLIGETARASAAEAELAADLIGETARASAAEAELAADLIGETARASAAEAELAADLIGETARASAAEAELAADLIGETARASAAEAELAADLAAVYEQTTAIAYTAASRAPGLGATRPIVMDETGRADLWLTEDGIDGRWARPSALRLPVTDGWRVLEMGDTGGVTRGTYDGVPYDPAAIGHPIGERQEGLGHDQVVMTVLDARTLAPESRQVTLAQTGDVTSMGAIGPALLRVRGPDPRYPVGAAQMVRRTVGAAEPHYLRIVITHGQSNGLGGRDEILTPQPALPDHVWMWNGGIRAYVPGASHTWEYIADPAMYTSLVPAKFSGALDQPRDYEGHEMGAGEAVALAYGLRDKVLIQNHAIAGRSVPYLVGDATSYAPAWQNLRNMVTAAVAQAASMGLIPIIEGLIWNSGEAHDNDTRAYWLEQVELIRSRTDELMSLTGQARRIPIVFVQVAASKNETGDSRYHEPCMATEEWVRDKSRFATIIPSMWSEQDDVAQVHHKARFYRHAGEMAGKIMVQMHDAGRHDHVMITAAWRRGRVVTVEFSEPIVADTYGVSDPGNLGVAYCQGANYITVRSVEIAGRVMRLTLGTIPSGIDERVYLGARGAKYYAAYNRWGIGAFYGNRHCIRGLNPESWSHSTCRPLWRWAPQQRLDVTVEDAAASFWTGGIWGGPAGIATWEFEKWGDI